MSTEVPFILGMAEAEAAPAAGVGSAAAGLPLELQQLQHAQDAQQDGVQAFAAPFSSQCEHHLLPFYGTLRLAYLPGPAGSAGAACDPACLRRRLGRVVEMFARRLQVQERLTHQVADAGAHLPLLPWGSWGAGRPGRLPALGAAPARQEAVFGRPFDCSLSVCPLWQLWQLAARAARYWLRLLLPCGTPSLLKVPRLILPPRGRGQPC